tara:strand:- start:144 stop:335 length:192 start_codon:yes stop_codon:yes gene_type:complete
MIIKKIYVRENIPMFAAEFTDKHGETYTAHNVKAFDAACSAFATAQVVARMRQKLGLRKCKLI